MNTQKRTGARSTLVTLGLLLVLLAGGLVAYRLISGQSLGLRSMAENIFRSLANPFKILAAREEITTQNLGNFTNIVFLHHSTGNNLVQQGDVRDLFEQNGYIFWDHGYNRQGLRGPSRKGMGFNYNVPNDNTDPDGLYAIFKQRTLPLPLNTLSALLQHEVIIVKSCFEPANNIASDAQLEMYKQWYSEIRDVMKSHPDRLFIILTTPPLNPAETTPEEAARAREYAAWLLSDEFLANSTNIEVFDFYTLLAENDPAQPDYNMLRSAYREGSDSHPTITANEVIGPQFVDFVMEKVEEYRSIPASN
jgi:hypothetical protein